MANITIYHLKKLLLAEMKKSNMRPDTASGLRGHWPLRKHRPPGVRWSPEMGRGEIPRQRHRNETAPVLMRMRHLKRGGDATGSRRGWATDETADLHGARCPTDELPPKVGQVR